METQKKNRLESHRSTSSTRHRHLPQEIVEQIMIKLPTKSILRFKCVSKSWRSLASNDRFIKAHLEKSSSKHESLERHHITFKNRDTGTKKRCSLASLYGRNTALVDFDYPTCVPKGSAATIVGSCNGLLCVQQNKIDFALWNPTTRRLRSLPPALDGSELNHHLAAHGFCFDGDYKVFGIMRGPRRKLLAKMYSSKTDSWRRVDDPVPDWVCRFDAKGRFAGGKLYWEACHTEDDESWRIVSFDLENEAFRAEEWPGGLGWEWDWFLGHAVDGSLCCFNPVSCARPDHVDYWVLEDDGRCWRRFATLGCPRLVEDEIEIVGGNEFFVPLFVGPGDGGILAEHIGCSVAVFAKGEEGGGYSVAKLLDLEGFHHTFITSSLSSSRDSERNGRLS